MKKGSFASDGTDSAEVRERVSDLGHRIALTFIQHIIISQPQLLSNTKEQRRVPHNKNGVAPSLSFIQWSCHHEYCGKIRLAFAFYDRFKMSQPYDFVSINMANWRLFQTFLSQNLTPKRSLRHGLAGQCWKIFVDFLTLCLGIAHLI